MLKSVNALIEKHEKTINTLIVFGIYQISPAWLQQSHYSLDRHLGALKNLNTISPFFFPMHS